MFRVIAFITMVIDHIGLILFPQYIIFRIIGRLAFPLFAFGIAQGYSKTRDVFNYGQRIFLLALISQPIFYLAINKENLNICFTLTLGLLAIYLYDKNKNWWIKIFGIIFILILSQWLNVDYGAYGVLMILLFFIFKEKPILLIMQSLLVFSYVLLDFNKIFNIFAILAFFLIFYVKDVRFKINKVVQYLFYPAHLLIIYIIYLLLNKF